MKINQGLIAALALTSALPSIAVRYYGAKPEQSTWVMAVANPLECRIVHQIPHFGLASFAAKASKKINMNFILDMYFPMGSTENVSLISMPAPWMLGDEAVNLEDLRFYKHFDGNVTGQGAWAMLSELESGYFPTFNYNLWQSKGEKVSVYLSSVAFKMPYNEFRQCVAKLLPFAFEDIAFTVLHYNNKAGELDAVSKQKLSQIGEYLSHSKDTDLVLLSSYTDSQGSQKENKASAKAQADTLAQYFISMGIKKEYIKTQVFGETRAAAVNDSVKGRRQNRRVVVSFARN